MPIRARFWSKVRRKKDGCWEWIAHKDKDGYGMFEMPTGGPRGVCIRATRVALALSGRPPTRENFYACHRCDTPSCVNPEHLYWGTAKTNAKDRSARGRHSHGGGHGMTSLRDADVLTIREHRLSDGWSTTRLAKHYSVSTNQIREIVSGRAWKHLPLTRQQRLVHRTLQKKYARK